MLLTAITKSAPPTQVGLTALLVVCFCAATSLAASPRESQVGNTPHYVTLDEIGQDDASSSGGYHNVGFSYAFPGSQKIFLQGYGYLPNSGKLEYLTRDRVLKFYDVPRGHLIGQLDLNRNQAAATRLQSSSDSTRIGVILTQDSGQLGSKYDRRGIQSVLRTASQRPVTAGDWYAAGLGKSALGESDLAVRDFDHALRKSSYSAVTSSGRSSPSEAGVEAFSRFQAIQSTDAHFAAAPYELSLAESQIMNTEFPAVNRQDLIKGETQSTPAPDEVSKGPFTPISLNKPLVIKFYTDEFLSSWFSGYRSISDAIVSYYFTTFDLMNVSDQNIDAEISLVVEVAEPTGNSDTVSKLGVKTIVIWKRIKDSDDLYSPTDPDPDVMRQARRVRDEFERTIRSAIQ